MRVVAQAHAMRVVAQAHAMRVVAQAQQIRATLDTGAYTTIQHEYALMATGPGADLIATTSGHDLLGMVTTSTPHSFGAIRAVAYLSTGN